VLLRYPMSCCGGEAALSIVSNEGGKFDIMRPKWDIEPDAIGEGGFGSVHLCKSKKDGKQRAIKAMKLANQLDREDFQNEFSIMQKIKKHRNICHILDGGSDARYGYLVMQSCSGGELFDRIASKDMTEKDAAIAVGDIIAALRYIHAKRVIHRDLKPENVLYKDKEPGSPLKLIDFGLAIQLAPKSMEHEVCGTTSYMAPEVLKGEYATECDMWSLGVVVYFMLSGSLPFKGKNDVEKESKILKGDVFFNGPSWDRVSGDGKDFVQKLLVSDPRNRMTGKQALAHRWIKNLKALADTPLNEAVVKNLKQHAQQNRFQRAVRHKMAMHLTTDELHRLRNMFEGLDTDGTGTVSIEELSKVMTETATDDGAAQALKSVDLSAFDLDGDGEIDWKEFVAGCLQDHDVYNEDNLDKVFKELDTDKSGTLSISEIGSMLGNDHELKREIMTKLQEQRGGAPKEDLAMTLEEFKVLLQDKGEKKDDGRSRTKGRRAAGHV